MYRGTDDGPWIDGIPFDGRDIYQWELVFDDSKANKWTLDKTTLVNLGRDRRPRCWPWSNDAVLPYPREGQDEPRPRALLDGNAMYHMCIGPFGCPGEDHSHNFAGAA